MLSKLSGEELGEALLNAVSAPGRQKGTKAWALYQRAVRASGMVPTPVTLKKLTVAAFCWGEDGVSAASRNARLTGAVTVAEERGALELTSSDRAKLKQVRDAMDREYPDTRVPVPPLMHHDLRRVYDYLRPYMDVGNLWALQQWAFITLGHALCLRGGEMLTDALTLQSLRLAQLSSGEWTFQVVVPFRKTTKKVFDSEKDVYLVPQLVGKLAYLNAATAMNNYLQEDGILLTVLTSEASRRPVFLARNKNGSLANTKTPGLRYERALREFRSVLAGAGILNASDYGLHSMRRGAATALLEAGLDVQTVMRAGGWVSPASVLRYDGRAAALAETIAVKLQEAAEKHGR